MRIKTFIYSLLILLLSTISLFSQVVYEPLNSSVYDFLDRISQRGVIEYHDLIKPLSRLYILKKLKEADSKSAKLTKLEKDELEFFKKDFNLEYSLEKQLSEESDSNNNFTSYKLFKKDNYHRFRVFSYKDPILKLNFSPVVKYESGNWDGEHYTHLTYGLRFYGYLGSKLGFQFRFHNNRQEPNIKDILWNRFSPDQGFDISLADKSRIEYSEVNAILATDWKWGSISVGQDLMTIGYAKSGQIILSAKAPAFPFVRLDIYPNKWLYFSFIHAWLNSDVIDSNSFYPSTRVRPYNTDRFNWRQKFFAQHSLTVRPLKGLDFTVGERVIYSDRLEISYLIPLMFFDQADEHLSRDNNFAGSNTQLFFAISSRNHIPNTHLWGSFFADELTPEGLFDPKTQYYKFGFTLGNTIVDLPINNLSTRIEYTKVYPGTYRHFIPTITSESSSYLLGNWIGDNADLIYVSLKYRIIRGLEMELWGQYIRKGQESLNDKGYGLPIEPFLYGLRKNYTYFGVNIDYEILHELKANIRFKSIKESKQKSDESFVDRTLKQFSVRLSYGF